MKKLIYILAASAIAISLAGCGNNSAADESTETAASAKANPEDTIYNQNDFAIYTVDEDLNPVKFISMLGVDVSTVEYTDEVEDFVSQFIETSTITVTEGDKENPGETIETEQVNYISYLGSRTPIINTKGILTTGLDTDDNENCSSVDDVIAAYSIDTENEEYIENKQDETGIYVIRLNFTEADDNGDIKRIISPLGTNLGSTGAKYSIRYVIRNDAVHGISYYMS